jgi:hypothetical protein
MVAYLVQLNDNDNDNNTVNTNRNKIMARPTFQSKTWDFTVETHPLQSPQGWRSSKLGLFRTDTKACLGEVSEHYGIVQNRELIQAVRAALEARNMSDCDENIIVTGMGEKMFAEYTFKNRQLAMKTGDLCGYRLTVKNSFDRTEMAAVELGFLRLACLNGMVSDTKEVAIAKRHNSGVDVKFVGDAIDTAMSQGKAALARFDGMADVIITPEQGQVILANLNDKKVLSNKLREDIEFLWLTPRRKEDEARNLWNLFNAVTEILTHRVSGERFEYANKVTSNVMFSFLNAIRNPNYLKTLLIPVTSTDSQIVEVVSSQVG